MPAVCSETTVGRTIPADSYAAFMAAAVPPSRSLIPGAYIPRCPRPVRPRQEFPMLDLAMLALGLASFAALIGYALLCERL